MFGFDARCSVREFAVAVVVTGLVGSWSADAQGRTWRDGIGGKLPAIYDTPGCPGAGCQPVIREMHYRYFLPANYDPAVEYPMVLFLHGSGESGRNGIIQASNHIEWMVHRTFEEYPAILVTPQLPSPSGWNTLSNDEDRTDEILDLVFDQYAIDRDRIYVTGLSMGGFGTMRYLQDYNIEGVGDFQFAAAAPSAGARFYSEPGQLDEVPIWLSHGDSDESVNVDSSRRTYNELIGVLPDTPITFDGFGAGGPMAENGRVRYTEYPGRGHSAWDPFYESEDFYEWMFAQSLSPSVPEPSSALLVLALLASGCAVSRRC